MSKEHIIAQLQGHTNYRSRFTTEEMEEALKGTYWKHDTERHGTLAIGCEPSTYYKFGELVSVGPQPTKGQVVTRQNWRIELVKHPYKTVLIPIEHLALLTHLTDPDELGMVALMYL